MSVREICELVGMGRKRYYKWYKRCKEDRVGELSERSTPRAAQRLRSVKCYQFTAVGKVTVPSSPIGSSGTCAGSIPLKLRTTNIIERSFREVRRCTRPMSSFNNDASCRRIIYSVLRHLNENWEDQPLTHFISRT